VLLPAEREDLSVVCEDLLSKARGKAKKAGVRDVDTVQLKGHVSETVLAYIESHRVDLLVMGSRGLSTSSRFLLGSVSDAVVHHALCPVLIVR
jgi:nucleotide-binding universal stress UspA family protein